jgi:hypothetical protein
MMEEVQAGIVENHMKRMERMGQQGSHIIETGVRPEEHLVREWTSRR